jgi:hypothetical protein
MTKTAESQEYTTLTREELDALAGEKLPERAAMSLINANVAAPINAGVALNVLSDGSVAYLNSEHTADAMSLINADVSGQPEPSESPGDHPVRSESAVPTNPPTP